MLTEVKDIVYEYVRRQGWVAVAVRQPVPPTINNYPYRIKWASVANATTNTTATWYDPWGYR